MKNNTNELNMKEMTRRELSMDELEQVCGGGAVHTAAKKKLFGKIFDWIWSWFE
ncbi:MAG: hypothetical protein IKR58_03695 [Lachnospiraceae bacterium]|nr:hypothetical protein [Lachnospiraceae bacterium]